MFDFLKKKISDFTGKIKDAIKAKPAGAPKPQTAAPAQEATTGKSIYEEPAEGQQAVPAAEEEKKPAPHGSAEKKADEEKIKEYAIEEEHAHTQEKTKPKTTEQKNASAAIASPAKPIQIPKDPGPEKPKKPEHAATKTGVMQKPAALSTASMPAEAQIPAAPKEEFRIAGEEKAGIEKVKEIRGDEKRELKAKVGLVSRIFGFVGGKIKITEKETQEFFDEFELSLLEGDVQQDAAQAIVAELKSRLVGKEISARGDVSEFLKREVKASLAKVMQTTPVDIDALLLTKKPLKIMFLGPNGAGKTTSIAKLANYFMKRKKSVILAAGDTFRAASIEQLEAHANALGVKVVKHKYGSDPAAVAFDAVKAAEAKGIDVVLIDTAGRQETNKNLLEELKKIERVVKPDLKLYVGEAYTGQALLAQATEFDKAIGLNGFVLTKIDTDTKGGTAISLLYSLKKPIVFVGTGQRYDDLLEFRPGFIIDRII